MNRDGSFTLEEAARNIARLKTVVVAPYIISLCADEDLPGNIVHRLKPVPNQLKIEEFKTLTELLTGFRRYFPEGNWLLMIKGKAEGFKNPIAAIDTPCIEKAIKFHTDEKHEGEI